MIIFNLLNKSAFHFHADGEGNEYRCGQVSLLYKIVIDFIKENEDNGQYEGQYFNKCEHFLCTLT
jgi:hypothetical protein